MNYALNQDHYVALIPYTQEPGQLKASRASQ
jgi:hypothetical protein